MTSAEWDIERDRREAAMLVACRDTPRPRTNFLRVLAGTTMPPRPVEPPSMTHYEWTITHDGKEFVAQHSRSSLPRRSHFAASMAVSLGGKDVDQLTLDLIALRDGSRPMYAMCVGIAGLSGEPLYRRVTP